MNDKIEQAKRVDKLEMTADRIEALKDLAHYHNQLDNEMTVNPDAVLGLMDIIDSQRTEIEALKAHNKSELLDYANETAGMRAEIEQLKDLDVAHTEAIYDDHKQILKLRQQLEIKDGEIAKLLVRVDQLEDTILAIEQQAHSTHIHICPLLDKPAKEPTNG